MTTIPERIQEEARKLIDEGNCADCINDTYCDCYERFSQALLAAEKRGREEERERCAVFLERFDPGDDNCRSVPAALDAASSAIRSTN